MENDAEVRFIWFSCKIRMHVENYTSWSMPSILSKIPRPIIRQMAQEHLEQEEAITKSHLSLLGINYARLIKLYKQWICISMRHLMQSSVYVFLDKIDVEKILQVTWICVKQSFPNHDNYTAYGWICCEPSSQFWV